MSGQAVDNVSVDVSIKFCDSRPNGFRDIRGADFVSNKRTNEHKIAYSNSAKRDCVSPKKEDCTTETSRTAFSHPFTMSPHLLMAVVLEFTALISRNFIPNML